MDHLPRHLQTFQRGCLGLASCWFQGLWTYENHQKSIRDHPIFMENINRWNHEKLKVSSEENPTNLIWSTWVAVSSSLVCCIWNLAKLKKEQSYKCQNWKGCVRHETQESGLSEVLPANYGCLENTLSPWIYSCSNRSKSRWVVNPHNFLG